jgi:hypothetical protein
MAHHLQSVRGGRFGVRRARSPRDVAWRLECLEDRRMLSATASGKAAVATAIPELIEALAALQGEQIPATNHSSSAAFTTQSSSAAAESAQDAASAINIVVRLAPTIISRAKTALANSGQIDADVGTVPSPVTVAQQAAIWIGRLSSTLEGPSGSGAAGPSSLPPPATPKTLVTPDVTGGGVRELLWSLTGTPPPLDPRYFLDYLQQAYTRAIEANPSFALGATQDGSQLSDRMFPGSGGGSYASVLDLEFLLAEAWSREDSLADFIALDDARDAPRGGVWWNYDVTVAGEWNPDSLASTLGVEGGMPAQSVSLSKDLAELSIMALSMLENLLGRPLPLLVPLQLQLQEVVEFLPLEESSLALTATLSTLPGDTPGGPGTQAAASPRPGALPRSPAWAGFVAGVDEALERSRRDARERACADALSGTDGTSTSSSTTQPTRSDSVIDEALRQLDREACQPPIDDASLAIPPVDERETSAPVDRWDAAAAASVCLLIVPIWNAGHVPPPRQRERRRPTKKDKRKKE